LKQTAFEPDVVIYDNYPGGIGQSEPLYRRQDELFSAALELVSRCGCEAGCPSCVGPNTEVGARGKEGVLRILGKLGRSLAIGDAEKERGTGA